MRLALALAPAASVLMAELSTSTVMPRRRSSRERRAPSRSSTSATLSSKRTPPTMTEPKPVIGPDAKPPVPPLPTPPPPPQPDDGGSGQGRAEGGSPQATQEPGCG